MICQCNATCSGRGVVAFDGLIMSDYPGEPVVLLGAVEVDSIGLNLIPLWSRIAYFTK